MSNANPPLPNGTGKAAVQQRQPLQVLIVDDDPAAADRMLESLREAGFDPDWRRVDTDRDFDANFSPNLDIVLSSYTLAQADPLHVLQAVRESTLEIPLIIVSGKLGDEKAAACLKLGATDYVLKDRMARLGSAVRRAIAERMALRAKREAEVARLRTEERMRGILASFQDVVWSLSLEDWKILYMSPAGAQMFGRPVEDFYRDGQLWLDSVHPADRDHMVAAQQEMLRWGTGEATFRIKRADGTVRHIHTRAWCAFVDGKAVRLEGINTDITEKVQAAEDARRRQDMLEEAEAIAHMGSWHWDVEHDRVVLSNEGSRIWGLPLDAPPQPRQWFLDQLHPEDRPLLEERIRNAVANGEAYDVQTRLLRGEEVRHLRVRGRVRQKDEAGKVLRLSGTNEDITERVVAEAQKVELDEVKQLNAFKSQFIDMVAHDLGNLVTPMRLNVVALGKAGARGDLAAHAAPVASLERGVDRLTGFLADLLDSTRLQSHKLRIDAHPTDLSEQVATAVEDLRALASFRRITLKADIAPHVKARVDERRIDQVLANLLSNALKFTSAGGTVAVSLSAVAGGVRILVQDTGAGLDAADIPRLFQPFAQIGTPLQGKHSGTGLGLFIARGIVEGHGGRIWVESAGPGKGCAFHVWLPAMGAPAPKSRRPPRTRTARVDPSSPSSALTPGDAAEGPR